MPQVVGSNAGQMHDKCCSDASPLAARAQAEALKTEAHLQAELKRVEAVAADEAAWLRKENEEALKALRERADVTAEPAELKVLEAFSADMLQRLERELAVRDKQAAEQVCAYDGGLWFLH